MPNPYTTPESDFHHDQGDSTSPFSIKGRFSRYSFLAWNFLLHTVIFVIISLIKVITGGVALLIAKDPNEITMFYTSGEGILALAVTFISLIFTIIFFIRRLHDINMSGWWLLPIFSFPIGLFFGKIVFGVIFIFISALFILTKRGTEGPNSYGPTRATPTWEKILGIIALIIIVLCFILIFIVLPLILTGME